MNTLNYISMSLDLFCIVISLIIFVSLLLERDRKSKLNFLFRCYVLCNIGIVSSDVVAWLMNGNSSWYAFYLVRASNFFHYAFGSLILAAMTVYMLAYIALKVKVRREIIYTVFFLCGLSLFLTIISQFTHMYYIIDENNVYHRQGLFWMSQFFPIAGLFINMGIIIFYRKFMQRRATLFFLSYMVVPVAAMSIQYMFYGITLVNIGTTLSVLLIYIGVQTEHVINLESAISAKNRQLELSGEYYRMLREHTSETKKARHDLRHHISLIQAYADAGEYEKLKAYVKEYSGSLPADTGIIFCENYAVNAILWHYADMAKNEGISFDARMELPENTGVSDTDLCIVFGNCIENAIEACRKVSDGRFIKVNSKLVGKMVAITVDNSFNGELSAAGDAFLSLKHEGEGIGTSSVKAIAEKYGGAAQFDASGGVFQVSVMLRVQKSGIY